MYMYILNEIINKQIPIDEMQLDVGKTFWDTIFSTFQHTFQVKIVIPWA